jgi:membrane-bound lytic murein transglycosylase D
MRRTLLALAWLLSSPAIAEEKAPVVAGPAVEPGDAVTYPPPTIEADEDGRRAVRGSRAERPTLDPAMEAMRAFELEAFTRGGGDGGETPNPSARPQDVRPDLPWLAGLKTGDIAVRWDPRVIRFLEFYRDDPRGRSIMGGWLRAQGRFREMILSSLRRHGLPEDLLYIAMIESSYDPIEVSRVGASGLWQFMPEGGHIYGLRQDHWVDERNDPEKSNEAMMF